MQCLACEAQAAAIGLLCEDCQEAVAGPYEMIPGQIVTSSARPTSAVLIDAWGRPHRLDAHNLIGRSCGRAGIMLLHATVSRRHAELTWDEDAGSWTLAVLGSVSPTTVDEEVVTGMVVLGRRARLQFGQVGFHFVATVDSLPEVELDPAFNITVPTAEGEGRHDHLATDWAEVRTSIGMPNLRMRLAEPTGGGAGIVKAGGRRVAVPAIQFELLAFLVKRMRDDVSRPESIRGYVHSTELIDSLSWDTASPSHDHLKHLVRRVRGVLTRAGIGDLIEARYRFGYRLRVTPVD